jgi:hypothetical protein
VLFGGEGAKGPSAKDIHKEMFPVYGGKCLPCKAFQNWVRKFSEGLSKVIDDAQPGHPVATEATVQAGGRVDLS